MTKKKFKLFAKPAELNEKLDDISLSDGQKRNVISLKANIEQWQSQNAKKIVAFVGRFGSGKSATLRNLEKDLSKQNDLIWLNFDAWRYADRTQLWDGFVIEVTNKIRGEKNKERIVDELSGIKSFYRFISLNPLLVTVITVIIWFCVSWLAWDQLQSNTDSISLFITALLKYSVPGLFALLAIIGISNIFGKSSPLSRVFQLEKMLSTSIIDAKKHLVIIVEDIDRAELEGITFLETVRNFLDMLELPNGSVIVIAPQDVTYISAMNSDKIKGLARSIKIYDNVLYYGSSIPKPESISNLLSKAKLKEEYISDFVNTFDLLFPKKDDQLSMRLVKFILREVDSFMDAFPEANPGVALVLISIRYIKYSHNNTTGLILEAFKEQTSSLNPIHTGISHPELRTTLLALKNLTEVVESSDNYVVHFYDQENEIEVHPQLNQAQRVTQLDINLHEKYLTLLD